MPEEPYQVSRTATGGVLRDRAGLAHHIEAKGRRQAEIQHRLAQVPEREVLLYMHGFNETFATAAYTAAELCQALVDIG